MICGGSKILSALALLIIFLVPVVALTAEKAGLLDCPHVHCCSPADQDTDASESGKSPGHQVHCCQIFMGLVSSRLLLGIFPGTDCQHLSLIGLCPEDPYRAIDYPPQLG